MNQKEILFEFETKYKFLYDIEVNGVPVYAGLRDGVLKHLQQGALSENIGYNAVKGRIFPKRILDGFFKLKKFKYKQTLIFTSSVFRRDKERNLAVEHLIKRYKDAAVFEWPSRNEYYDRAYFSDKLKASYCPMDYYILLYKMCFKLYRKQYVKLVDLCSATVKAEFKKAKAEIIDDNESAAVKYLIKNLPESYAATVISQKIFKKLFHEYKDVKIAIDYWGSAKENIIPVLPGNPESVELQHGIITANHQGYIYPEFLNNTRSSFFGRTLLVYGEKTKQLLMEESIFKNDQIKVIGNPRIEMYKREFPLKKTEKKLILFTSQPFEQDGAAVNYYNTIIPQLKKIEAILVSDRRWEGYQLGIKLHPRENNGVQELYRNEMKNSIVYDNASQLFELLNQSYLHFTVSSTTLYEAALFDVPTILIEFNKIDPVRNYGFSVQRINLRDDMELLLSAMTDEQKYADYLQYLKNETLQYM